MCDMTCVLSTQDQKKKIEITFITLWKNVSGCKCIFFLNTYHVKILFIGQQHQNVKVIALCASFMEATCMLLPVVVAGDKTVFREPL